MGGHFLFNTHYNLMFPKENLALIAVILNQKWDGMYRNKKRKTYREFLYRNETESKFMKARNSTNSESYQWKEYEIKCRIVNKNMTLSNETKKIREVIHHI